jgi:hypothetical protein
MGNLVETSCGPGTEQTSLQHQANVKIPVTKQFAVVRTFMESECLLQ